MLKDEVRTRSYRNAIVNSPHLIKDKIVSALCTVIWRVWD